jgi:ferredoxin
LKAARCGCKSIVGIGIGIGFDIAVTFLNSSQFPFSITIAIPIRSGLSHKEYIRLRKLQEPSCPKEKSDKIRGFAGMITRITKITKNFSLRLYVRPGCLVLAIILLLPFPFWIDSSRTVVQASSFVTLCTILAGGTIGAGVALGVVFAVISLVRKRWFCRFICPVGLILDNVSRRKLPVRIWWKGCPPVGAWIVVLTAAGALLGYPLFLWMDPLAFFNSSFSVIAAPNLLSGIASLAGMVILLSLAFTSGDIWCVRLCPLGATQDILENAGSYCRNFRKPAGTPARMKPAPGNAFPATRRAFIAITASLGFSLLAIRIGQSGSVNAPLRPPGAITGDKFTGLCVRCGNCIRACPSRILHPDMGQAGILGFLSPVIRYETDYCLEECNACTKVCPSGALQTLNLEQKQKYVIGRARLDRALCLWGISDCNACVNACYFKAIKIVWDKEAYESYPVVDPGKCNGCGACEVYCPTGTIKAIKVWPENGDGPRLLLS